MFYAYLYRLDDSNILSLLMPLCRFHPLHSYYCHLDKKEKSLRGGGRGFWVNLCMSIRWVLS